MKDPTWDDTEGILTRAMQERIAELESRLKDAEDVLVVYAYSGNWGRDPHEVEFSYVWFGGATRENGYTKALEYFEKYFKDKI